MAFCGKIGGSIETRERSESIESRVVILLEATLALALVVSSLASCGRTSLSKPRTGRDGQRTYGVLDRSCWSWFEAECIDRPLDLFKRGFEQQLRVRVQNDGLLLTFDNEFLSEGCEQTIVMSATPALEKDQWQIVEEARVAVPMDDACFGRPERVRAGVVRLSGDVLELLIHRSDWCNGFDVRFAYRSIPNAPLTDRQLIRHYAAHFNRRDPASLADLFADTGLLVEALASTADGNPKRHRGRKAVERFFHRTFQSTQWHALRITAIEQSNEPGYYFAKWDYMDSHLEKPFGGRNLFIVAEGEIYQTEIHIAGEIVESTKNTGEILLNLNDAKNVERKREKAREIRARGTSFGPQLSTP